MKTHILFLSFTALLMVACASHEGRKVSSTQDTPAQQEEYVKREGNAGRELGNSAQ